MLASGRLSFLLADPPQSQEHAFSSMSAIQCARHYVIKFFSGSLTLLAQAQLSLMLLAQAQLSLLLLAQAQLSLLLLAQAH